MSNIQARIGEGLSRLQLSLEQGKQRLHTTQEISKLHKAMEETSADKAQRLLELGQLTHLMLRDGKINVDERPELSLLQKLSQSLVHVDQTLFRVRKQIQQLSQEESDTPTCECGTEIQPQDKFCAECGQALIRPAVINAQHTRPCFACETDIPKDARFCGCCGTKQAL